MIVCRYSLEAEVDLEDIFEFTAERFGLDQARKYGAGLITRCEALHGNEKISRSFGQIRPDLRRANYESHAIYFRRDETGILVLRILHQSMDPGRHL